MATDFPRGLGQLPAAKGDHWAAADTFEALTAIAPNSVKAWTRLALEFQALNRHSDAADAFRKVLELNPGLAAAQYGLGRSLAELRRTDEATQILSALQDPANESVDAVLRAKTRMQLNKLKQDTRPCYIRAGASESNSTDP